MADRKISDLTALTTPASGDFLPIVDISEAAAASKNKRITIEELMRGVPDGTAAAPGIAFETDPNTGIYSPGADQLAVATNGTGRLFVNSTGLVGVGTSSPNSILHTAQDASTYIRVQRTTSGTEGNLYLGCTSSANQIISEGSSSVAKALRFDVGSTEAMRITSAGLVGIGTSAPGVLLDVGANGTAIIRASNTNPGLSDDVLIGGYEFHKADASGSGAGVVGAVRMRSADSVGSSAYMTFSTALGGTANDAERVRITGAGNVGIGTTSPSATLELSGAGTVFKANTATTTSTAISLQLGGLVTSSNSGCFIKSHVNLGSTLNSQLSFEVNGGALEAARMDSSGRLLVGTSTARSSSTQTWLSQIEAVSNINAPNVGLGIVRNQADIYGGYLSFAKTRGTSNGATTIVNSDDELGGLLFSGADGTDLNSVGASIVAKVDGTPGANDMPGRLVFSTTADGSASPTERMRISANGSSNFFNSTSSTLVLGSALAAGTSDNFITGLSSRTTNSSGGSTEIVVRTNGNVLNSNNSYGSISDIKLKENIVNSGSQWNDLKALQVRKYNFKEGQTHTQIGLVAQEVELVSPGLVSESPDRDEEGNDLGTVTKSVNYSVLYMKAVKALQEAMERIETLEQRLTDAGIA